MKLTNIIALSVTGTAYAANPMVLQAAAPKMTDQPNIIVIYTDDQRFNTLGANDNDVIITPNLDKFLARGTQFTSANVAFSLSSPSRAAMLTGRYGSANGVLKLDSKLNDGEKTVASYLHDQGYHTGIFGKWHIKQRPHEVGFDEHCYFLSNGTYYNRQITDMGQSVKPAIHCDQYCVNRSIDFIRERGKEDKPFFLFHCTQLPHMNGKLIWDAKDETKAKYDVNDMPYPENRNDNLSGKPSYLNNVRNRTKSADYGYPDAQAIQRHNLDYYSVVTEMDEILGQLIDELEAQDMLDNTYIFFMGDNGWMVGDHGFTSKVLPYEASTNVPFFVLGPDIKAKSNDSYVSNIDIAPTIMQLAGMEVPETMHGKSLLPMLRKNKKEVRKAFVYEGLGTYGGTKPLLAVLSDNYRYIVTYTDATLNTVLFEELYDMDKDPHEMNNIAQHIDMKKQKAKLQKEIEAHKAQVLKK